ncbi:DUF805 domain-containing protein [Companilactobacillus furfuricola]|uniref:DUF805 domain-containing protein n=1 Tax=Companilactobacillus furfuricola TaxID=1462575 RepID=UPI000F76B799|nr:DUF805 domain-containing protein [Companilactobacillus furfuricola]
MDNKVWNESEKPGIFKSTRLFYKNLFVGASRCGRADYWWSFLGSTLFTAALIAVLLLILFALPISDWYWSAVCGVGMALCFGYYLIGLFNGSIRRLHDIGFRAWWLLLLLIPVVGLVVIIILLCLPQKKDNRFPQLISE